MSLFGQIIVEIQAEWMLQTQQHKINAHICTRTPANVPPFVSPQVLEAGLTYNRGGREIYHQREELVSGSAHPPGFSFRPIEDSVSLSESS